MRVDTNLGRKSINIHYIVMIKNSDGVTLRNKLKIWCALGLLMLWLTFTGALLTSISSAQQTSSSMTFSLGIADNDDADKNGAQLLTLKFDGISSATTIVAKNGTPTIDGQDGDAAWGSASTVSLSAAGAGGGPSQTTIKAAYDSENIYFLVTWTDPTGTESIHKKMWTYNATSDTWSQSGNEDRVYFLWNINAPDFESGCAIYCHVGMPAWENSTQMGTNEKGTRVDVWHWKAARTHPMDNAEDKYWVDLTEATEIPYEGGIELRTRLPDLGGGFTSDNKEGSLPKYMDPNDPGENADFLFQGSVVDFNPNANWQDGDTIPGYIVKNGTGSRADVEAVGVYSNGVWTVEFKRALHTGNPDDVSFMSLYASVLEGKVSEQHGTISGLEDQVSGQQNTISDLQGQVTDLEERVSGLESTTYIYLGGGLIAGLAVGAIIVYAVRRKPT